jgi:hypothetical protein
MSFRLAAMGEPPDSLRLCFQLSESQEPEDQSRSYELYVQLIADPSFPALIFELFRAGDLSATNFSFAARCLKDWAAQWPDNHDLILEPLTDLVVGGQHRPQLLADMFVSVAKTSQDTRLSAAPFFDAIPVAQSVGHVAALLRVICFLCRYPDDPADLLEQVISGMFAFFSDENLLLSAHGCKVLKNTLTSFQCLFLRCRRPPDFLVAPQAFVIGVLGASWKAARSPSPG